MFRSRFTVVAALAAFVSVAAVGVTGASALASASSRPSITCTGVSGAASGFNFYGCSGNTGGNSQILSVATLGGGGTITWANSPTLLTTTIGKPAVTVSRGACADTAQVMSEWTYKGTVTADETGSAPVGGGWKVSICVDIYRGGVTMPPGAVAVFK